MAGKTGRDLTTAFAKFGTGSWGQAAAVNKVIHMQSDGNMKYEPALINDESFGQRFLGPHDVGNVKAPVLTLPHQMRYGDYGYVWEALCLGSPATVTLSNSATGQVASWRHVMNVAPNIDGLGLTWAIDKGEHVEELTSAKVHGFSLENGDDGVMVQSFFVTGSKPTIASTVNTPGQLAAAVVPSLRGRVTMAQGVFRMNLNSGSALASTDQLELSNIKLMFNRPQDAPHAFGQSYVIQPADNGFPEFKLELEFPRFGTSSTSMRAALESGVAYKADWIFSGDYINSTDRYQIMFEFPYLQFESWAAPTNGGQQIKQKAVMAAKLAPTSPTGMAFVNPMRMTRIMDTSVGAFAA